jgi:DUF1680 family protein
MHSVCGRHANTIIPKLIGAAKRYMLYTSSPEYYATLSAAEKLELETLYLPAAEKFFDIVLDHHTYANGGHAQGEFFHEPDQLWYDTHRAGVHGRDGGTTAENCGTYNMLKLARLLFQATRNAKYSEYYERAFLGQILGSKSPETAANTYFNAMSPGYAKIFGNFMFFCCEGSGIEGFTKLNESLYFTDEKNVWVNMFFASTFRDARHNLMLTVTGDVPKQDAMTYTVAALEGKIIPADARLKLRLPQWSQTDAVRLVVDGVSVPVSPVDGWLTVPVRDGTEIVYALAPKLWTMSAPDSLNWVAFFYGPALLAAQLNQNNIGAYKGELESIRDTTAAAMAVIYPASTTGGIENSLIRVDDLSDAAQFPTFRTVGAPGTPLTLVPFYSLYQWRYAVYLNIQEKIKE